MQPNINASTEYNSSDGGGRRPVFVVLQLILLITAFLFCLIPNFGCLLQLHLKRMKVSSSNRRKKGTVRSWLHLSMLVSGLLCSIGDFFYFPISTHNCSHPLLPVATNNSLWITLFALLYLLPLCAIPSQLVFVFADQVLAVLYPHRFMKRSVSKHRVMAVSYVILSYCLSALSISVLLLTLRPHSQQIYHCNFQDIISIEGQLVLLLLHVWLPLVALFVLTGIFHRSIYQSSRLYPVPQVAVPVPTVTLTANKVIETERTPLYTSMPSIPQVNRCCCRKWTPRNLMWTCVYVSLTWLPMAFFQTIQILLVSRNSSTQKEQVVSEAVQMLWQVSLTLTGPMVLLCQYVHARRSLTRQRHSKGALFSSNSVGTSSNSSAYCQYCSTTSLNRVVPWRRKNFSCSSATSNYSSLSTLKSSRMLGTKRTIST